MFDGLVLCIERKKLQSGKPTGELLGDNILFEKCKEFTIRETFTGILGDNILFKKCQIMKSLKAQDRNWLRDTKRMKLLLDSKMFGTYVKESTTYG